MHLIEIEMKSFHYNVMYFLFMAVPRIHSKHINIHYGVLFFISYLEN